MDTLAPKLTLDTYSDLMRKHVEDARRMSSVMARIPSLAARAERMRNCSTLTRGRYCPHCHSWHTVQASLCRDRLCPNCGWALARKRASALASALEENPSLHLFHIVLTMRNCSLINLDESLATLLHASSRFTTSRPFRRAFVGYARNVEIKVNKKDVHPHIHMLALSKSKHPMDKDRLSCMWQNALDVDYIPITWIKEAYGKVQSDAVYECIKYCVKSSDWLHLKHDRLISFASAIHGKKLFSSGGILAKLNTVELPDSVSLLCENCGTRTVDCTLDMKEIIK